MARMRLVESDRDFVLIELFPDFDRGFAANLLRWRTFSARRLGRCIFPWLPRKWAAELVNRLICASTLIGFHSLEDTF